MNVVCFGDSNTYGYDPRGYFGGRYDPDCRWADILASRTGWKIQNMGQNGRTIPAVRPAFPDNTDLLIIMLGTNDLLEGLTPEAAADRMMRFLSCATAKNKIYVRTDNDNSIRRDNKFSTQYDTLLIAPPPMIPGEWVPTIRLIENSKRYGQLCEKIAQKTGIRFADAGKWNIDLTYDGVHFSGQGHRTFADALFNFLCTTGKEHG